MTKIALALGSNMHRQVSLTHAVLKLNEVLHNPVYSSVYETVPLHAKGPEFYNAVVIGETDLTLADLISLTKKIERDMGRTDWYDASGNRISIRCLDIDILLYGDMVSEEPDVPREDIYKYPFATIPLLEVDAGLVIPDTGKSITEIASGMNTSGLKLIAETNLNVIGRK